MCSHKHIMENLIENATEDAKINVGMEVVK